MRCAPTWGRPGRPALVTAGVLAVLLGAPGTAGAAPASLAPASLTPASLTPASLALGQARQPSLGAPLRARKPAAAPRVRPADAGPTGDGLPGTGLHWVLRSAQPLLVVDLVDTTGPAWPVRAAARSWNSPRARFVLAEGCRALHPCVVVGQERAGASGWTGATMARPGQMFSFTSPVRIALNDSYPLTTEQRQAVACHELGHALGLEHDTRASSCMRPDPVAVTPDRADLAALAALYPPVGPALSRRR